MPCLTCVNWDRPTVDKFGKQVGRCKVDGNLAHAHYHCAKHESASANADTAGLTDDEIAWLRTHRDAPQGEYLLRLYGLAADAPDDPGARGIFQAALNRWRARLTGKDRIRQSLTDAVVEELAEQAELQRIAEGRGAQDPHPPADIACKAMLTGAHDCGWPGCFCERGESKT